MESGHWGRFADFGKWGKHGNNGHWGKYEDYGHWGMHEEYGHWVKLRKCENLTKNGNFGQSDSMEDLVIGAGMEYFIMRLVCRLVIKEQAWGT